MRKGLKVDGKIKEEQDNVNIASFLFGLPAKAIQEQVLPSLARGQAPLKALVQVWQTSVNALLLKDKVIYCRRLGHMPKSRLRTHIQDRANKNQ